MNSIVKRVIQKNLFYKGTIILKYKIEFPQIPGRNRFNMFYLTKAKELKEKCEGELFEDAKKTFDFNQNKGYPTQVYEVDANYTVTSNYGYRVSLFYDYYIFTGGAHGVTTRKSQTWCLLNEKILPLSFFYEGDPNFIPKLLKKINDEIKNNIEKGENIYFENPCCLTAEYFNTENYYLYEKNIIIYYQQYEIGPYSSGIISFAL